MSRAHFTHTQLNHFTGLATIARLTIAGGMLCFNVI